MTEPYSPPYIDWSAEVAATLSADRRRKRLAQALASVIIITSALLVVGFLAIGGLALWHEVQHWPPPPIRPVHAFVSGPFLPDGP